jgi:hypothetical protein
MSAQQTVFCCPSIYVTNSKNGQPAELHAPADHPVLCCAAAGECEPGFGFKPWSKPKYYADKAEGTCELCEAGSYAPGGYAPCRPCGTPNTGFTTPNGAYKPDQCFCKPGFGGVGCDHCPTGTYRCAAATCVAFHSGCLSADWLTKTYTLQPPKPLPA